MRTLNRRTMLDIMLSSAVLFARSASAAGQAPASARQRIIVFDVNETLMDLGPLAGEFERVFGNSAVAQEWFSNVILYSQVSTIAGPYVDFGTVARATLDMTLSPTA